MCTHCGCSTDKARLSELADSTQTQVINLQQDPSTVHMQQSLLAGNDAIAQNNRQQFSENKITCINLMGTPGAGKTQLIETLLSRSDSLSQNMAVLEGDQETSNDAARIEAAGGKVLQINTGTGCHLDAEMIDAGVNALADSSFSLLMIENVGNLVCPALFDLGESARIAIMAVTDGEDKPIKYPHMFSQCDLVLINKSDLLPYVDFDLKRVKHDLSHLNPGCPVLAISAKTGEGIESLESWLKDNHYG